MDLPISAGRGSFFNWSTVVKQCCVSFRSRANGTSFTQYHGLDGLKNRHFTQFWSLDLWRVLHAQVLGRVLSLAFRLCCLLAVSSDGGESISFLTSPSTGINPTKRISASWPHLNQITSKRPHLSMLSYQGGVCGVCVCVCVCVCVLVSHVQLFAIPRTIACQPPLSMEFPRQEYWSGLPFPSPGDLPISGIESWSPALEADSLLSTSELWVDTSIQSIMLPKPPLHIHINRSYKVRLCYCPAHVCNLHCTRNPH